MAGQSFYRYMSRAELQAVEQSGMLRGGVRGRTYWSTDFYEGAGEAKRRLALGRAPEIRIEFKITNEPLLRREGDLVDASMGEPGGGTEYMSTEQVHVEVIRVDNLD